jgi:hypothetical protein
VPQVEDEVVPLTCTVALELPARLPKLQLSVWPEMEHVPGPLYAGLMLQFGPVGRVSLRVAEVAVPAPVLLTTTVKPIVVPSVTGVDELGVLVTPRDGHSTVMLADACAELALLALAVACVV